MLFGKFVDLAETSRDWVLERELSRRISKYHKMLGKSDELKSDAISINSPDELEDSMGMYRESEEISQNAMNYLNDKVFGLVARIGPDKVREKGYQIDAA